MPWNVNGTFTLNQDFVRDRDLGRPASLIDAAKVKDEFANVKAGLEASLSRQGYNSPSADISWGNRIITNYGTPAARNDVMNAQATSRNLAKWCTISGTSSAWTATNAMASNVLLGAVEVMGIAPAHANAGCTFALGVTSATEIRRANGDALVNGDIRSGSFVRLVYISPYWRVVSPLNSAPAGDPVYVLGTLSSPDGGTPNVYAATVTNTEFPGLRSGQMFLATMHRTNTGDVTLGINGASASALLDYRGNQFGSGELLNNSTVLLRWNGTNFRVVGSVAEGGGGGGGIDAISDATDVDMNGSPNNGVLRWDTALNTFVLRANAPTTDDIAAKADTSYVDAQIATRVATSAVSTFGGSLIDDADAGAARTTLGLGTMALEAKSTWDATVTSLSSSIALKLNASAVSAFGGTLIDDADAGAARTTLGLGALATLAAVGTSQITDANVTTAKLADDSVTNAKLANMAQNTIKGRISSGSGDPEDLTAANVRSILGVYPGETALTYGATTNWDVAAAPNATLITTGNTTIAAPTNIETGRVYRLRITKDIKANTHSFTFNSAFRGIATNPVSLSGTAAGISFTFIGSGSELYNLGNASFA